MTVLNNSPARGEDEPSPHTEEEWPRMLYVLEPKVEGHFNLDNKTCGFLC